MPAAASLVKLRFFAGLTIEQAAQRLGTTIANRRAQLDLRTLVAAPRTRAADRADGRNCMSKNWHFLAGWWPLATHCYSDSHFNGRLRPMSDAQDRAKNIFLDALEIVA